MMVVYEFETYREALQTKVREWKQRAAARTLTRLADSVGVQVSYLSNVLKNRAHLSSDQLFALCQQLGFLPEEMDYLLLLQECERTGIKLRKEILQNKISRAQSVQLRTDKRLRAEQVALTPKNLERYYLDPIVQLVHIYLGMKTHTKIDEVCAQFSLTTEHAERVLQILENIGYVEQHRAGYKVKVEGRHLPKDSPVALPHLILMRMKSIDQLQKLNENDRYAFSATIATTREVRVRLERELIKFLTQAEEWVAGSPSEELYQLNFDLFPWKVFKA